MRSALLVLATTFGVASADVHELTARPKPIALVILYNGSEHFTGTTDPEDTCSHVTGLFPQLPVAIEKLDLGALAPATSTVSLVTYGVGARVRVPWTPLRELSARSFGTKQEYAGQIGIDLVDGLELAIEELEATTASTRVLVVIGDGTDTNHDSAPAAVAELGRRAKRAQIDTTVIVVKSAFSSEDEHTSPLFRVTRARDADQIARFMRDAVTAVTSRTHVLESHEPGTIRMPKRTVSSPTSPILVIVLVLAGAGALALVVRALRSAT